MKIHMMENDNLRIGIADQGAELVSIYDKSKERELVWQADPAFWNRHAPVLFPNVGQYYGKHFLHHGTYYAEGQHGFARDMEFVCVEESKTTLTHRLISSGETRKRYPFEFCFEITHTLKENTLTVGWKVRNTGDETMYFTIGGHPAFNVPPAFDAAFEDCSLLFEKDLEELHYILLDTDTGTACPEKVCSLPLSQHRYPLKKDMFDKDALVFDGSQISYVALSGPDGRPYIAVKAEGFPNFGIWSKPGAPYVCLEPWCGRCDNRGFEGELSEKEGIIRLEAGKDFCKSYDIIVY